MIQSIKTFIIMNPLESMFTLSFICIWLGSYLESIFKFWDWGPQCNKCKEWFFWEDTKIHCTKCDDHRCNDEYQAGMDRGILEALR
jgi:hypothetical protein